MQLPVGKIERTLKVLPGCADILFGGAVMLATRVLLVDGNEVAHMTLAGVLEQSGFAITSAANAAESLRLISGRESNDLLLSDLHMPGSGSGSGDALTVVSAMRHANSGGMTRLLSAFHK
jgi:CheY-like chemotaxis protein